MKIKQISILTILFLLLSMTVGSCYKEDVNTLYSRQYALAGSLKALNEQVNKVNENISNLREIIQILENKEPISALEYDIVTKPDHSKDTIGVKVTIGAKQIYIPFGRDGKDGKDGKDGETPQVEIGSNGNWFVNGKDTGVPATGQDGKTPKIGAMQDPDNPTDENFYWTISYGDGKPPVFILDANGNKIKANGSKGDKGDKGDQGEQGNDGVNSPITGITIEPDGTVVIHTTLPIGDVRLPGKEQTLFDIKPEKSLLNGADASARFDEPTRSLMFEEIAEEIEFPFEKSDKLTTVYAALPRGWEYRIDQVAKKIYVTSPKMGWGPDTPHTAEAIFFARDADGKTYSRNLNLKLKTKIFLNYFFNDNPKVPIYKSNTPYNTLTFSANKTTTHVTRWHELDANGEFKVPSPAPISYQLGSSDNAILLEKLRQDVYRGFDKPATMDNSNFAVVDFFYDNEYITYASYQPETTPNNAILVNRKVDADNPNPHGIIYQEPVPWDTYASYSTFFSGNNSDRFTVRLQRVTQKVRLRCKSPKTLLGLASSDDFDLSRVVLKIPTTTAMQNGQGKHHLGKFSVTKVNKDLRDKDGNPILKYDSSTEMLTAEFATFLPSQTMHYAFVVEYTKQDGSLVKKTLIRSGYPFSLPSGGNVITFNYNYKVPEHTDLNTFQVFTPGAGTTTTGMTVRDPLPNEREW